MDKIRIGTGSGGCTWERIEPAVELLEKGSLDYLVFECLSERTIADLQKSRLAEPGKGYNPQLEERMYRLLPLAHKKGVRIVSNMGGANTPAAVEKIRQIAGELGIHLKIAMITGDDITDRLADYASQPLLDQKGRLGDLHGVISANAYLGAQPIAEALDTGADMVITGRVADVALFVGPVLHKFKWTQASRPDQFGQAILLGHLMECGTQITGGYYAEPGYKDVPGMHVLGFPIAEIDSSGNFEISKVNGSGGLVSPDVCKEQLLYEIGDPSAYITPDAVADFSHVSFWQTGENRVACHGATSRQATDFYKVNIGYQDMWFGEASVNFGGSSALARARLMADAIRERLKLTGMDQADFRLDFLGYNALYGEKISSAINPGQHSEIQLRMAVRARSKEDAAAVIREIQWLYINGPAGSCGIRSSVSPMVSVENILVPKKAIQPKISIVEA